MYGAGGAGREITQLINDINKKDKQWNIIGFIDDNDLLIDKIFNGIRVIGNKSYLNSIGKETFIALGIANPSIKRNIVNIVEKKGDNYIKWATLIHPNTYLSKYAKIEEGSIICFNNIISCNAKIGRFVYINFNCIVPHDTTIKDYSSLMNNVVLSGNIVVNEGVFIGSNAVIIQNLEIGHDTVIGAGTVVIDSLPSNITAVGNPAKIINIIN
jgi:sugar O-acyltransferase (sialic acid O-acetyltransferase NeuD family)